MRSVLLFLHFHHFTLEVGVLFWWHGDREILLLQKLLLLVVLVLLELLIDFVLFLDELHYLGYFGSI
jgi:hypothetical protein